MMTLQKLKIFAIVCEQGSLNKAAQTLYLSQSAVSQHIQDLEASLGTELLQRTPRGTHPTEAGDILLEYAYRVQDLLAEAEGRIMQIDRAQDLQLSIGATPGISTYFAPQWLRRFQAQYPNIQTSMNTELTGDIVRGVLHHRHHFGFMEGALNELEHADLGSMVLRQVPYDVVVHPHHKWAGRDRIVLDELVREPFINRQPSSRTRRWLEQVLALHGATVNTRTALDSPGTIKYALLDGAGVAILPRYAIEREVERGELATMTLADVPLERPVLLLWATTRPLHPMQRAFLASIASEAPAVRALV
jgi:DNA-binding transcriptional LysR family regulator